MSRSGSTSASAAMNSPRAACRSRSSSSTCSGPRSITLAPRAWTDASARRDALQPGVGCDQALHALTNEGDGDLLVALDPLAGDDDAVAEAPVPDAVARAPGELLRFHRGRCRPVERAAAEFRFLARGIAGGGHALRAASSSRPTWLGWAMSGSVTGLAAPRPGLGTARGSRKASSRRHRCRVSPHPPRRNGEPLSLRSASSSSSGSSVRKRGWPRRPRRPPRGRCRAWTRYRRSLARVMPTYARRRSSSSSRSSSSARLCGSRPSSRPTMKTIGTRAPWRHAA